MNVIDIHTKDEWQDVTTMTDKELESQLVAIQAIRHGLELKLGMAIVGSIPA